MMLYAVYIRKVESGRCARILRTITEVYQYLKRHKDYFSVSNRDAYLVCFSVCSNFRMIKALKEDFVDIYDNDIWINLTYSSLDKNKVLFQEQIIWEQN